MKIYYDDNEIKNKQFLTPTETNKQPIVKYTCNNNDNGKNNLYSLIMYDPDSIHGTYIHWAVINIPNNDIKNGDIDESWETPVKVAIIVEKTIRLWIYRTISVPNY